jgi:opacity protein-like surface antigen
MSFRPTVAVALIVIAFAAVPAAAEEWHARFAASWTETALSLRQVDESGDVTRFEGGDSPGVSLGLERRISDLLGLEVGLDASRPQTRITVETPGADPISATARMNLWAVRGGLNLHLLPRGSFDLYVGPTVAWLYAPGSVTFRAEVAGHTSSVTIDADNSVGWGGTAGADVDLSGGWTLNVSYTYLKAEMGFSNREEPGKRTLDLDPSILRLGVGVRF